jgi:repressor LexA
MGIRSHERRQRPSQSLERKGFLTRDDLKSRAIRPIGGDIEPEADVHRRSTVPPTTTSWRSRCSAESPPGRRSWPIEHAEDRVRIDRCLLGDHREVFALRICGESMIEDGIFDGDFVFIEKTPSRSLRRDRHRADRGRGHLQALLPGGRPHPVAAGEQRHGPDLPAQARLPRRRMILGRVVGVYRRM